MADRPSVAEALRLIAATAVPLGTETVPVTDALGRWTAAPVHAAIDVPRFRAAAMDGYAFAAASLTDADAGLRLADPIAAGTWPPPLAEGFAAPISTGAPVPEGADVVLVREQALVIDGRLRARQPLAPGRNVRAPGEDARAGQQVLPAGARIGADAVGALAAYGVRALAVRRLPRLALFATGSELADIANPLGPAALVDSNGPMIAAAAQAAGLPITRLGRAADTAAELDAMLDTDPSRADILLSTGGVSGGAFDLVRAALERRDATILFHGLAMRPGKPLLFAQLADGRLYFGLPGNPVAAMVGFRFFVAAAVRRMLGLPLEVGEPAAAPGAGREGTTLFLRARRTAEGFDVSLDQRSHILGSLLAADCWLVVDPPAAGRAAARAFPKDAPSIR